MKKILNNPKECALAFVIGLIIAAGIIASSGSFNWAKTEGWLFVLAGVLNIAVAIYAVIAFYCMFLKPDEKPMTISEYEKEKEGK